jgi:hypothetical protein
VYVSSEEKTSWSTVIVLLIGAWTAWRAYVDYTAEYVVVPPSYLSSDVLHARNPPSKVWQVGRTSPNELTFYYDQHQQGGARPTQPNQLASRAAPLALPAPLPAHQQYGGAAAEEQPWPEQPQQRQQQQKSTGWCVLPARLDARRVDAPLSNTDSPLTYGEDSPSSTMFRTCTAFRAETHLHMLEECTHHTMRNTWF